jgi:glycosyltransferase involved in cell wall biosynthesis
MTDSSPELTKILLILAPFDFLLYPSLMAKKLNEITLRMDNRWKIFAITAYSSNRVKLPCQSEFHTVPIIGSPKNVITRIPYLLSCILEGVKLVKHENIHVITHHDGHLEYGMVAYIISRLTHRRCLIRVNEDTLIPFVFFLKRSGNYLFRSNSFLKLVALIYRKTERNFFRRVDWVVTHGPMDYEKIRKITDRITLVPLWIDTTKFKRVDGVTIGKLRKELGVAKEAKVLLFVGRLHPEKGLDTLFEALKIIKHKDILLLIIHSSVEYKEDYQTLAGQLGISDRIRFVGYILHDDMPKYYSLADAYVLPSVREEWSNTIMEAMACETPVIATDVGGNHYQVTEGKTGFLVPVHDPLTLAQKIQFVLENPNAAKQVASEAVYEIKKYDKDNIGDLYTTVVKNLIKSYGARQIEPIVEGTRAYHHSLNRQTK